MRVPPSLAFVTALICMVPTVAAEAADQTAPAATPCATTTVAAQKAPTGPAQFESGTLTLGNGATLRLQGTPAELSQAQNMAVGDPVAACYGPLKTWADAGPSRTITVLDLKNGAYYATLIGTWNS